jgi:hypothetical protein
MGSFADFAQNSRVALLRVALLRVLGLEPAFSNNLIAWLKLSELSVWGFGRLSSDASALSNGS